MKPQKLSVAFRCLRSLGWLALLGPLMSLARADDIPPPPPADPNGAAAGQSDPNVEVLTRGPVHEAFAVPVTAGQTAGMIVPKQPAGPIEEVPPDMKPEGENSVWIPGYWSWDDDRKDFIWVSGVWRVPPPGFRWMPGYWQEAAGQGYQWISGYWMPAQTQETTFMPQPPQSVEAGPNSDPPSENHFWVPGNWQWHETRYAWQAGYWSRCQPDWIWVPATYYWCPRGWVYVPGYWDYPLARRGLVFSPVYFVRPVAFYRPAVCLDVGAFGISFFCRPSYCHYYFGDYYDDRYVAMGIRPWFYYNSPRHGYDPLYSYYRWYHVDHLGERQWDQHLHGWHDYYRGHPDMRPPHTLAAQQMLFANHATQSRPDFQQLHTTHDIHQFGGRTNAFVKLQPVSQVQRTQFNLAAKETSRFGQERQQFEKKPLGTAGLAAGVGVRGPTQPEKVSLAKIPNFNSTQLPGAAASNFKPLLGQPTGGNRVTGAAVGGQPTLTGNPDRKTTWKPGGNVNTAAGNTTTGNAATGSTSGSNPGTPGGSSGNPAGRLPLRPGNAIPGGTIPNTGAGIGPGPGRGTPSGGGNPGSGNRGRDKEREKKPQASFAPAVAPTFTPATAPAVMSHSLPNRKVEHLTPSNTVSSSIAVPKPQPQPQVRTVTAPPPPPVRNFTPPPPPVRTVAPPSRPQPPANNNPGGRSEDTRRRDREKDKK